ncbi:unnamed protein product [Caenorhabditis auriculariae]|uniref:G protein-coupled receptor n=1 Tax=Caenorhabditis auriculariae TaxID=2777116 RepID=A0A8S1HUS8_9PELO|nr:unnamed protein product [Caenorhabditis auriculariae]
MPRHVRFALPRFLAFQVYTCDLMRPIVFFPVVGYGTYGLLNDILAPFTQLQVGGALAAIVIVSTGALFEYRHHAILSPNSPLNFPTRFRVTIFIFRFILGLTAAIGFRVLLNDQEQGRRYWMEIISAIETFLFILTTYCIIFRSPKSMKTFKWLLLHQQFWLFGFQLLICDLIKPILFLPLLGYSTNGLLNDIFSPFTQFQIAIAIFVLVIVSTAALFEYRHNATLPPDSLLNFSTRTRNAPCQLEESDANPSTTFFFTIQGLSSGALLNVSFTLLPTVEVVFYAIDSYRRCRLPSTTISNQTRQIQLNFLRALIIQECAPLFIAYPEPFFYVLFSSFTWVMLFAWQIYLCDVSRMVLFVPVLGVRTYGILNGILSPFTQYHISLGFFGAVLASTSALFEYRHHAILPPHSRLKLKTPLRLFIFIMRPIYACNMGTVWNFVLNDQVEAKRFWQEHSPCQLEEFEMDTSNVVFFTTDVIRVSVFFGCIFTIPPVLEIIFYVANSFRKIKSSSVTISSQTRRLHYDFLKALCIQECAPVLISYPFPIFYIVVSSLIGLMSIDLNNLAILITLTHGISVGLAVILVNRPYREFLYKMILCKPSIKLRSVSVAFLSL